MFSKIPKRPKNKKDHLVMKSQCQRFLKHLAPWLESFQYEQTNVVQTCPGCGAKVSTGAKICLQNKCYFFFDDKVWLEFIAKVDVLYRKEQADKAKELADKEVVNINPDGTSVTRADLQKRNELLERIANLESKNQEISAKLQEANSLGEKFAVLRVEFQEISAKLQKVLEGLAGNECRIVVVEEAMRRNTLFTTPEEKEAFKKDLSIRWEEDLKQQITKQVGYILTQAERKLIAPALEELVKNVAMKKNDILSSANEACVSLDYLPEQVQRANTSGGGQKKFSGFLEIKVTG